jgi:hypothetical protein
MSTASGSPALARISSPSIAVVRRMVSSVTIENSCGSSEVSGGIGVLTTDLRYGMASTVSSWVAA